MSETHAKALAACIVSGGSPTDRIRAAIQDLGPHPARRAGLRLEDGELGAIERWLVLACLLDPRTGEAPAVRGLHALDAASLFGPAALDVGQVVSTLEGAGIPRAPQRAVLVWRVVRALAEAPDRFLDRIGRDGDDLESVAGAVGRLAPGLGRATVARFLAPLRGSWPSAADLPLDPAAQAAAFHLDLIAELEDPESATAALASICSEDGAGIRFEDAEWSLSSLGRSACRRSRIARCPLGAACPARER